MILLDTSILIGYIKGSKGAAYAKLDHIIENDVPHGICGFVYQEVLQGVRGKKEYDQLDEYLSTMPFYELQNGQESYASAAEMYMNCRKQGISIKSTLTCTIAVLAIENGLHLLHDDNDFNKIARVYADLKLW